MENNLNFRRNLNRYIRLSQEPEPNAEKTGLFVFIISLFLVFLVLPYSIWNSNQRIKGKKERAKYEYADVIKISGLRSQNAKLQYKINGKEYIKTKTIPSGIILKVGQKVKIQYDSINPINFMVLCVNDKKRIF